MMRSIYLDHAASTPIDPRVRTAMEPFLSGYFGNPHAEHADAVEPADAIAQAATLVAELINADAGEIVFTSGATEANNTALKGVMLAEARRGSHLIVSAIEHSCVLEAARWLERQGCDLTVVPVRSNGTVAPDVVVRAVRDDTALVSIGLVNNELGTLQPLQEIADHLRGTGVVFHTDAAQAPVRTHVDVHELGVDLLSLSGHKMAGPKGVGALFVSLSCPVRLEPLLHGGGQQGGRRGGTVPTFLCVGLGEAAKHAAGKRKAAALVTQAFERRLRELRPNALVNGGSGPNVGSILNVRIPGVDASSVLQLLYGRVSASMGSACHAGSIETSHVLAAIGLAAAEVAESIRFSFSANTSIEDAERSAILVASAADQVVGWGTPARIAAE